MARRANGEGTIYKLPDGRWRAIVSVRVGGKLQRKTFTRKKRADVVANMEQLKAELSGGMHIDRTARLVDYLNKWLETILRPHCRDLTYDQAEVSIRLHIAPRFPTTKLAKLTAMQLEEFKSAMVRDEVGPRAAQVAYEILRRALRDAVYPLKLIGSNPCDGIKPPKHDAVEMVPFEAFEAKAIIASAKGTVYEAMYSVAFGCGLRFGELCGLQWQHIDWEKKTVSIERQLICRSGSLSFNVPKTKGSVRKVDIPDYAIEHLHSHRVLRMKDGQAGSDALVFGTRNGTPYRRANFYAQEWLHRLADLDLSHRGFHNTRHTFATLAILDGEAIPVVSKALGHSNPATTMRIYAHVLPSASKGAAAAMNRLLG